MIIAVRIEDDTSILPRIVASGVIDRSAILITNNPDAQKELYVRKNELIDFLTNAVNVMYENDPSFKRMIYRDPDIWAETPEWLRSNLHNLLYRVNQQGDARDTLYWIMQDLLAIEVRKSSPKIFDALLQGYGFTYRESGLRPRDSWYEMWSD